MAQQFRIEPATPDDVPRIFEMIKALAEYERLSDWVSVTESMLREALFGRHPVAEAIIAFADRQAIGYAIFFPSFSTFSGKPSIHLEDLFVEPTWRSLGVGGKLLAYVAVIAVSRGCERVNWSVLQWNEPAIRFYDRIGAEPVKEWTSYSISGQHLIQLARESLLNEDPV